MTRWLCALIVCALLAGGTFAHPAQAQTGFDRPGGDYTNFVVRSGDPSVCALRCEREGRCRAWSFDYPTATGAAAVCWLKSRVTPRTENSCCVSGVRGAAVMEPKRGAVEFSIDRTGGDYRSIDLAPDPSGDTCAEACKGEARCRAWTYLRPGYHGPAARCFLKDHLTAPRHRPCCISGVIR